MPQPIHDCASKDCATHLWTGVTSTASHKQPSIFQVVILFFARLQVIWCVVLRMCANIGVANPQSGGRLVTRRRSALETIPFDAAEVLVNGGGDSGHGNKTRSQKTEQ